jgi:hypothetical protein
MSRVPISIRIAILAIVLAIIWLGTAWKGEGAW